MLSPLLLLDEALVSVGFKLSIETRDNDIYQIKRLLAKGSRL